MTDKEVLEALHINYVVDIELGEIYSKKTGKPLFRFYARIVGTTKRSAYPRVSIKHNNKRSSRAVNKLIWMYSRNTVVPPDCEIHHLNVNHSHNHHKNLICIHKDDHRLIHLLLNGSQTQEAVPF